MLCLLVCALCTGTHQAALTRCGKLWFAEQKVHTRECQDISLAYLYATTPHMFSAEDHTEQAFNNVRDAVRTPLYGCDCYAYGLLAAGCVDLVVEAELKPYDYMALVPIVQEAGGVMTDWLVRLPAPTCFCAIVVAWLHAELTWHESFLGTWAEASKVCTTLMGITKACCQYV